MSDKIRKIQNPVVGVVAGQTATCDLAIGPRYHVLWLEIFARKASSACPTLLETVDIIKLKINDRTQREVTATELNALYTLLGAGYAIQTADGYHPDAVTADTYGRIFRIPIFFAEPWRKGYAESDLMALPTKFSNGTQLRSLSVEIGLVNTSGVTEQEARVYAEVDEVLGAVDKDGNPMLNLSKWRRKSEAFTGNGWLDIVNLPRNGRLQQLSAFAPGSETILQAKVEVDNKVKFDQFYGMNKAQLNAREFNSSGHLAQRFDLVFDYDDIPASALRLDGANQFKVSLQLANATTGSLVLLSQVYGPLD